MRARDVMTRNVIFVGEDAPLPDVARTLLEHRIGAVPVLDGGGKPVGIVSEGDLMRRPESRTDRRGAWWLAWLSSAEERAAEYVKSHGRRARDVMTRPVVTVEESTPLEQVADLLERRRIKRVPVVSEGRLVGILSRANLLHGLATIRQHEAPITSDDETIRASALETIREQTGVRDQFLNVVVSGGTVHLWGAVQSEAEKQAVRVAAENTIGVQAVVDHLGVLPPQLRSGLSPE